MNKTVETWRAWGDRIFMRGGMLFIRTLVTACAWAVLVPDFVAADGLSCPDPDAAAAYEKMKQRVTTMDSYRAVYFKSTERGPEREIYSRFKCEGRYMREPAWYCEKRLSMDASFPEQAAEGYQQCYKGSEDMTRVLMPGALRIIGQVPLYPEDPKSDYINGENFRESAAWTWVPGWDRVIEDGKLSASCRERRGGQFIVLEIKAAKPSPVYNHIMDRVWVNPETWFPERVEKYVPDEDEPVMVRDHLELELDAGLTEDDMGFEGLSFGWNLAPVPEGPKLDGLAYQAHAISPGPSPQEFLAMLDRALAEVSDYTTMMTFELLYHRLRQYRKDRFVYVTRSGAFATLTRHLESNYVQMSAGRDFRTVYDPTRDGHLHILPAGIYRVTGEQAFPLDDPRLFTSLGDNVTEMNFFAIRNKMKSWMEGARQVKAGAVDYQGKLAPCIKVHEGPPEARKRPYTMTLVLDPETKLPWRLIYTGYDDPKAYISLAFENTRTNTGITEQDLWE